MPFEIENGTVYIQVSAAECEPNTEYTEVSLKDQEKKIMPKE